MKKKNIMRICQRFNQYGIYEILLLMIGGSLLLSGCSEATYEEILNVMEEVGKPSGGGAGNATACQVRDPDIAASYDGGCQNGFAHGSGIAQGRDRYEGNFVNGWQHGQGVYTWGESEWKGDRYEGDWLNGKKQGYAVVTYAKGDFYEGTFAKDGIKSGYGTYRHANGDRYKGEFKNDRIHGHGVMTYANGRRVEGEFANGKLVREEPSKDTSFFEGNIKITRSGNGTCEKVIVEETRDQGVTAFDIGADGCPKTYSGNGTGKSGTCTLAVHNRSEYKLMLKLNMGEYGDESQDPLQPGEDRVMPSPYPEGCPVVLTWWFMFD